MSSSGVIRAWSISVANYGAVPGTDATTAFNNAMTAASAKVNALSQIFVYVPSNSYTLTNITVPNGVFLFCDGSILINNSAATGSMITLGTRSGISGAYLAGAAVVGASAITTTSSAFHAVIRNCQFDNWDGRAIYDQGLGTTIENCFGQNCLLGANNLTGPTGVVELAGTDAFVYRNEFTASRNPGRGQSTNGRAYALAVTNANNMVHSYVAETSDSGVYIASGATQSQFIGVRAELNYRHGWDIQGGGGEMVACHALRNSQAGANLYNGFNISAAAQFIGRALYSESGGAQPTQNNALSDTGNSQSVFSTWDIKSVGDNIPLFTSNSGNAGFVWTDNPPANLAAGTATPDGSLRNYKANNTIATNVTSFPHTVNGQPLRIKGDGFTTLVNGASIATLSGANLLLAANTWYEFIVIAGVMTQTR